MLYIIRSIPSIAHFDRNLPESDKLLASIIAITVGFGAAVVGALATRRAAERQARSTFEAQRVAHEEALQNEVRLAQDALKREIEINNSIMSSKTKLFRRVPLQKPALDRVMRIVAELPYPVVEPMQNMYFFIEKYNSLVSLLNSADASVSPEIIAEIERMTAAGIKLLHQSSKALDSA